MSNKSGQASGSANNSVGAVTPILFTDAGWSWSTDQLNFTQRAYITPQGQDLMITWSGVDPTSTLGHRVFSNTTWCVEGLANILALKILSLSGTINVSITLEN